VKIPVSAAPDGTIPADQLAPTFQSPALPETQVRFDASATEHNDSIKVHNINTPKNFIFIFSLPFQKFSHFFQITLT
jgi:hypothetical protein